MKRKLFVILSTVVLLLVGGFAWASIPNSHTGVFSGCVGPIGQLRVVDSQTGETCRPGEQSVFWNQQGPPGAPASADSVYMSASGLTWVDPGGDSEITISCGSDKAMSGGYHLEPAGTADVFVHDSHPTPDDSGWFFDIQNLNVSGGARYTAYVECLR